MTLRSTNWRSVTLRTGVHAALDTRLPQEWQTILRLVGVVEGMGPNADVSALDEAASTDFARRRNVDIDVAKGRVGPERMLEIMLRAGPYELTLSNLEAAPHGVDLGPLTPRLPEALSTACGTIELAPVAITKDVPRLTTELGRAADGELLLIGRRHLSSNNSWMHNVPSLVRGSNRCTLQIHPHDASARGLVDGGMAEVSSTTGLIRLPVEVTSIVRPGVVSVPHGWGHDAPGTRTAIASTQAGVNVNLLADGTQLDAISGTAVLNGIPVHVQALTS